MYRRVFLSLLIAATAVVPLAGCGAENQTAELTANPWATTQIQTSEGMAAPLEGTTPAVYFRADGTVIGNATVNTFKGAYTLEGRSIRIEKIVPTEWPGSQMETAQDAIVLEALSSAERYHIQDGILQLSDNSGNLLMGLAVAEQPKLVGPVWACTACVSDQGDLVSTVGTSPISASFAPDGALAGFTGVNQYSATYEVTAAQMIIGPEIASTKMAGPEQLMSQEARYFDAIARTESHQIEGYQLSLIDANGAVLATYVPGAPK